MSRQNLLIIFPCLKAFIIAHEIGHHVLEHTTGAVLRVFTARCASIETDADSRALQMEYEADRYGYKLFHTLSHTVVIMFSIRTASINSRLLPSVVRLICKS